MKLLVTELTFKQALPLKGGISYVNVDQPNWRGWVMYADLDTREMVITMPVHNSEAKKFRVPLENVLFYVAGTLAPAALHSEKLPTWQDSKF